MAVLLQSFMASGRAQADFQPMPLPQLRLSVQDQCRLRDRSTIMARQMYAGQGSQYADAQVCTRRQQQLGCGAVNQAVTLTHGCMYGAWLHGWCRAAQL